MMKRFLAVLFLLTLCFAAIAEDTQVIVCSGTGKDQSEAEKAALRSAVEQAVGALVDAETLVKNDEVVNNQVLSHSDGFVEKWEPIGEPKKGSGGETTVKIKAVVRRNKLIEKLTEVKVTVKDVDGKSLFGEVVTKMEGKANAADLLKKVFEGIPETLLVAEVKDQKVVKEGNPSTVEVTIEVKFDWDAYTKFGQRLKNVLDQVCVKKSQSTEITQSVIDTGNWFRSFAWTALGEIKEKVGESIQTKNWVMVNCGRNQAGDNLKWHWFVVDPSLSEVFNSEITVRNAVLRLDFVGKNDQSIREDEVKQNNSIYDLALCQRFGLQRENYFISPFFFNDHYTKNYRDALQIKWQASFSLEELKQLQKIKCSFVPLKANIP